jgi:cell division protein FtsZ
MSTPTETRFEKVLGIGVGGGGGRIVRHLAALRQGDWLQLAHVDCDAAELGYKAGVLEIPVGREWSQGVGCGGDAVLGQNVLGDELDDIRTLVQKADLIILVGSLGGGMASGGIRLLSRLVRQESRLGLTVVTLPLAAEGSERNDVARESLADLRRHDDVTVCVANDLVFEQLPPETPVKEALQHVNARVAETILGLAAVVRCRDGVCVQYAELRRLLHRRPADCAFGTAVVPGTDQAGALVDELLAAPLLGGPAFLQESHVLLAVLTGDPSLSVQQMEQCFSALRDKLNPLTRTVFGAAPLAESPPGRLGLSVLAIHYEKPLDNVDRHSRSLVHRRETMKLTAPTAAAAETGNQGPLGIFVNSTPTMRNGENLDIPTFLRRHITLEQVRNNVLTADDHAIDES